MLDFLKKLFKGKEAEINNEQTNYYGDNEITFRDQDLKSFIKGWTDYEGFTLDTFVFFLKSLDVKLPARLYNYESQKNSFKCISSDDNVYSIALKYGSMLDSLPEIELTHKDISYIYEVHKDGVKLRTKTIKNDMNTLVCSFYSDSLAKDLYVGSDYVIEIWFYLQAVIDESEIENYLLSLSKNDLSIEDIYSHLCDLYELNYEKVKELKKIEVSIKPGDDKHPLAKILTRYGLFENYSSSSVIDGKLEFVNVSKNGDWSYIHDTLVISYSEETKKFKFSINGEDPTSLNMVKKLQEVTKKINEIAMCVSHSN